MEGGDLVEGIIGLVFLFLCGMITDCVYVCLKQNEIAKQHQGSTVNSRGERK